jgi:hypothetical protein
MAQQKQEMDFIQHTLDELQAILHSNPFTTCTPSIAWHAMENSSPLAYLRTFLQTASGIIGHDQSTAIIVNIFSPYIPLQEDPRLLFFFRNNREEVIMQIC